jgi:hypothetical protein
MSNIDERIKRLDILPARLLTTGEINQGTQFNTIKKFSSIISTRFIAKIPTLIRLPAPALLVGALFSKRLYIQWNISIGQNWYVEPPFWLDSGEFRLGFLTVKFIIAGVVSRYVIGGYNLGLPTYIPPYQNQELPSNCSFEYWSASGVVPVTGLTNDFFVKTSMVQNPTTGDDIQRILVASGPFSISDLGFNTPVNTPIVQPLIAFSN